MLTVTVMLSVSIISRRLDDPLVVGKDFLAYGRDEVILAIIPPADVAVTGRV